LRFEFTKISDMPLDFGKLVTVGGIFLSLALGIGASASMFGVVDSLLFRPLPVPQTDEVLRITSVTAPHRPSGMPHSRARRHRKPKIDREKASRTNPRQYRDIAQAVGSASKLRTHH
jgi:hypothetical protein